MFDINDSLTRIELGRKETDITILFKTLSNLKIAFAFEITQKLINRFIELNFFRDTKI